MALAVVKQYADNQCKIKYVDPTSRRPSGNGAGNYLNIKSVITHAPKVRDRRTGSSTSTEVSSSLVQLETHHSKPERINLKHVQHPLLKAVLDGGRLARRRFAETTAQGDKHNHNGKSRKIIDKQLTTELRRALRRNVRNNVNATRE